MWPRRRSSPRRRILPVRAEDKDFPVSWIRSYEKGRVFYSSLGHGVAIYSNPVLLEHFLAGIQYALGDLKADSAPSGEGKRASSRPNSQPLTGAG